MKLPGLFLNAKTVQEVPAGTLIFEAGSSGTVMFGIVEGEVEVRLPNGAVRRLGPDDTFGEMAVVDSSPRSATVVAVSDTKLAVIDRRTFLFLVHETPTFALEVMSSLAERLRAEDSDGHRGEVPAMTQPATSNQAADLMAYLTKQREHVLGILENLSEEAMRRPVLPTGWTCAGLVQHLALDVERFWFRQVMAGEHVEPDEFGDDGWQVRPDVSAAAVLDLYRREIELADKIIAATSLESPPAWWPDFFPNFHLDNLRQVILHVIAETGSHTGHLDAARELIDGETWLILT